MSNMTTEQVQPAEPKLTAADRCDRCGAQAYVMVDALHLPNFLLFCGHHFHGNEDKLRAILDVFIHDEREMLNDNRLRGTDHA